MRFAERLLASMFMVMIVAAYAMAQDRPDRERPATPAPGPGDIVQPPPPRPLREGEVRRELPARELPAGERERATGARVAGEGSTRDVLMSTREGGRPGIMMMEQVERMRNWLDVVDRYVRMARDPVDAGIAAVITANDLLRPRGADAAISYFTKLLPDVTNDAVKRAIRLQLIELYKASGQQDKALEHLQSLITSVPPMPHDVLIAVPHQSAPVPPIPHEQR